MAVLHLTEEEIKIKSRPRWPCHLSPYEGLLIACVAS
jgi:hypothetical protein